MVSGTCSEYGSKSGPISSNVVTSPITDYAKAKDDLRKKLEILAVNKDFDFQWADYYVSWDDYIQTRVAQRNRQFGPGGTLRLFDMISCDSKRNVFNVFQGNAGEIFEGTESTLMGVQYCQGRGATTADAIARAVQVGQVIGVNSGVDQLLFGGPSNTGEDVGIRFATRYVFPNGESFAERMDALRDRAAGGAGVAYSGDITCGTPGLWLSHRIHQEN